MNQYSGSRHAGSSGGHQGSGYRGGDRSSSDAQPTISLSRVRFGPPLSADLYSEVAEAAAQTVANSASEVNKSSQLRRFYDELVMWQEKVGRDPDRFKECEPFIQMLRAKTAYALGRKHVDANFRALFDHVIKEARDADSLRHAKLFMEAFMAFYKVHKK
jgi:CRISPR-associated protein Csm2